MRRLRLWLDRFAPDRVIDDLIADNAARVRFDGFDPDLRDRRQRQRLEAEKEKKRAAQIESGRMPLRSVK